MLQGSGSLGSIRADGKSASGRETLKQSHVPAPGAWFRGALWVEEGSAAAPSRIIL